MGIRTTIYRKIPYNVLFELERSCGNPERRKIIQMIRLERFVASTDFSSLDVENMPVCVIDKSKWDYPLFQMDFFNKMIASIIYCLADGYVPQVRFMNSKGELLWEKLLKQPYEGQVCNLPSRKCTEIRPALYLPNFPTVEDVSLYGKLYKTFFVPTPDTLAYFNQEEEILMGKRVVGVLCRGTDYTANRPKWHPIQPDVDDVISDVKAKMKEYYCDYIYLATDEEQIKARFEKTFPNLVLTNKRHYYDEFYDLKKSGGDDTRISWVSFDRENDNFYKSLEYLSSINLLSKCNLLIAGSCGGSRAALYMNDNQYEYVNLYNLGVY